MNRWVGNHVSLDKAIPRKSRIFLRLRIVSHDITIDSNGVQSVRAKRPSHEGICPCLVFIDRKAPKFGVVLGVV